MEMGFGRDQAAVALVWSTMMLFRAVLFRAAACTAWFASLLAGRASLFIMFTALYAACRAAVVIPSPAVEVQR